MQQVQELRIRGIKPIYRFFGDGVDVYVTPRQSYFKYGLPDIHDENRKMSKEEASEARRAKIKEILRYDEGDPEVAGIITYLGRNYFPIMHEETGGISSTALGSLAAAITGLAISLALLGMHGAAGSMPSWYIFLLAPLALAPSLLAIALGTASSDDGGASRRMGIAASAIGMVSLAICATWFILNANSAAN